MNFELLQRLIRLLSLVITRSVFVPEQGVDAAHDQVAQDGREDLYRVPRHTYQCHCVSLQPPPLLGEISPHGDDENQLTQLFVSRYIGIYQS